ncbi:MAG: sulfurtransferase [Acidiferrobacterales bacterium]|nr:sulfurtransferase [Acidiferrobacterales bacterium]
MVEYPLISANEALSMSGEPDVRFVDATWYLPNVPSNAFEAYQEDHIPGSVYFDIDEVAEPGSDLPHVFPSLKTFSERVGNLGISESDRVIVYDRSKFVASARAWWMFHSFGHREVRVLNGGLNAWKRAGGLTDDQPTEIARATYVGLPANESVILRDEVAARLDDEFTAILDARSHGRFSGSEPEPRPGLRGGHIPGSMNLYYGDVMDSEGYLKSANEVADLLLSRSVSPQQTLVTTCGSGVTAAILLLAIFQFQQQNLRLYDGSWTEWALHPDSPIQSG